MKKIIEKTTEKPVVEKSETVSVQLSGLEWFFLVKWSDILPTVGVAELQARVGLLAALGHTADTLPVFDPETTQGRSVLLGSRDRGSIRKVIDRVLEDGRATARECIVLMRVRDRIWPEG